jgi:hypothetical protein
LQYLPKTDSIPSASRRCFAMSGTQPERTVDGWRISGRWGHATGAPHATHFTLNAALYEGGQALRDASGAPRVRAFIGPAAATQPGALYLSDAERKEHHEHRQGFKTYEERKAYMDKHLEQMATRMQERGDKSLPQPRRDACVGLKIKK